MQPRFRGQLRNLVYKNCTDSHLIQPKANEIFGGVSLIPNSYCSENVCENGICLIAERDYRCLCDENDFQGKNCQNNRGKNELIFTGKDYLRYDKKLASLEEILTFKFQTNHYNGLLFQLIDSQFYIKLKQGQLIVEYRLNNSWYEISTSKDLNLIDNQWHYVQIKRHNGQIALLIDQYYIQNENEIKTDHLWNFTEIFIGGNLDNNIQKFYGCLKDISMIFNENLTIHFNQSLRNLHTSGLIYNQTCQSLVNPIRFLTPSSFLTMPLENISSEMNLSFHFETYSLDCIIFYSQSNQDFLGVDLIDGFVYLTINMNKKKQRKELFQQRFNDGQTHFFQLEMESFQQGFELNITMDYRQNTRILIRNPPSKLNVKYFDYQNLRQ